VASFEEVGRELPLEDMVRLPLTAPEIADGTVRGIIDTLDVRYGSLWTSIPRTLFGELGVADGERVMVRVLHHDTVVHAAQLTYARSFAAVEIGESLLYVNSLDRMAIAINRGHYARAFSLGTGASWHVTLEPVR
ncbi:MAG TPA: SAM hydroxide adenosyltransferase, partial [Brevibacterium sp.]|nr:SAM hydroxide adenosyltransferase [Brevibacterium sp.]